MNVLGVNTLNKLTHVAIRGGRYFCIYSRFNFETWEFETAVYDADKDCKLISKDELYITWWDTREEMIDGHFNIACNLTEYLQGVI